MSGIQVFYFEFLRDLTVGLSKACMDTCRTCSFVIIKTVANAREYHPL